MVSRIEQIAATAKREEAARNTRKQSEKDGAKLKADANKAIIAETEKRNKAFIAETEKRNNSITSKIGNMLFSAMNLNKMFKSGSEVPSDVSSNASHSPTASPSSSRSNSPVQKQ